MNTGSSYPGNFPVRHHRDSYPHPDARRLAFSAEHLHLIRYDFGSVPVTAIAVLPFSGLKTALDIDGFALGGVFTGYLREPSPQGNVMPLCLVFPFAAGFLKRSLVAREKLATAVPEVV